MFSFSTSTGNYGSNLADNSLVKYSKTIKDKDGNPKQLSLGKVPVKVQRAYDQWLENQEKESKVYATFFYDVVNGVISDEPNDLSDEIIDTNDLEFAINRATIICQGNSNIHCEIMEEEVDGNFGFVLDPVWTSKELNQKAQELDKFITDISNYDWEIDKDFNIDNHIFQSDFVVNAIIKILKDKGVDKHFDIDIKSPELFEILQCLTYDELTEDFESYLMTRCDVVDLFLRYGILGVKIKNDLGQWATKTFSDYEFEEAEQRKRILAKFKIQKPIGILDMITEGVYTSPETWHGSGESDDEIDEEQCSADEIIAMAQAKNQAEELTEQAEHKARLEREANKLILNKINVNCSDVKSSVRVVDKSRMGKIQMSSLQRIKDRLNAPVQAGSWLAKFFSCLDYIMISLIVLVVTVMLAASAVMLLKPAEVKAQGASPVRIQTVDINTDFRNEI